MEYLMDNIDIRCFYRLYFNKYELRIEEVGIVFYGKYIKYPFSLNPKVKRAWLT